MTNALAERPRSSAEEQAQAAQEKKGDKVATVRNLIVRMGPELAKALPSHINKERLERLAITYLQEHRELLECDVRSLLGAIMQCGQLGLEPDSTLGHAYFVPFKGKVTFIVGYKGYVHLARNSGLVAGIWSRVVHRKDQFEVLLGTEEKIVHVPSLESDPGDVTAAYAVVAYKDGFRQFEVMPKRDLDRIRDASLEGKRNPGASPWVKHEEAMQAKCPIRRLSKVLPLSPQMARAMELDDEQETRGEQKFDGKIIDVLNSLPEEPGEGGKEEKKDALGDLAKAAREKAGSAPGAKQEAAAGPSDPVGDHEQPCWACTKPVPIRLTTMFDGHRICPDCEEKRRATAKKPAQKQVPPAKEEKRKETPIEKAERIDRERAAEEPPGDDGSVAEDLHDAAESRLGDDDADELQD